ncbi:glycerol acyltransferase [Acinetobacter sp. NCu2D-2]|uniref:lysophospholipid acyltransferase family protein n=1 Tax=Acinetobacter sp. NCu2D-2 TaxID=1608473 RepID=UPI0007CDF9CE|nr:lysophospholipid acyltransferase family protein [Acinetobacter sp. NCu2D-2]ANF82008.1 glycerol acyltransferase [Acinetobacter sp. NCu2D-2]
MHIGHDAKWIKRLTALSKLYFTPTFLGAEHIDASKPAMYVGNHSIYGVFDSPIIVDYLYNEHKVAVVSIADHSHFYIPLWRDIFKKFGAIDGVKEYVREAMRQGYSILVFPGGGREVSKRDGEQYQLIWKERYGFLKLAQEFNYDIVPFAALGGDELYEIGLDATRITDNKLFKSLLKIPKVDSFLRHGDVIPSLPKHLIPKRLPFYFQFLAPQSIAHIQTQEELVDYRDTLQQSIYTALNDLKQKRKLDYPEKF